MGLSAGEGTRGEWRGGIGELDGQKAGARRAWAGCGERGGGEDTRLVYGWYVLVPEPESGIDVLDPAKKYQAMSW